MQEVSRGKSCGTRLSMNFTVPCSVFRPWKEMHSGIFKIGHERQLSACIFKKTSFTWVLATSRELRAFFYIYLHGNTGDLTGPARWPLVISRRVFSGNSGWGTLAQLLPVIGSWPFYLHALSRRLCYIIFNLSTVRIYEIFRTNCE